MASSSISPVRKSGPGTSATPVSMCPRVLHRASCRGGRVLCRRHRGRLRVLDARHPSRRPRDHRRRRSCARGHGQEGRQDAGQRGGRLNARGRPGVHIPSDRLQIPTPTPEDFIALDAFVDAGVDMVAVSFVRSAHDMRRVGTDLILEGAARRQDRDSPPSTTCPASSRRPVRSWSLAAISATSAALRISHTCKRTSSASASLAAAW